MRSSLLIFLKLFGKMKDWIACFFRSINANIVTTHSAIGRKFLKLFFLLSFYFSRWFRKLGGAPSFYIINNFDTDLKLKIDRSRSMGSSLYWTGFHEFRELLFLHRFLQPSMVAIDVGANLGEYTLFMAKRLHKGKVISFEPVKETFSLLTENVNLNSFNNVELLPFGLGSKSEEIIIHEIDDSHEGLSTLYPGDRKIARSFSIELRTFDDEFQSLKIASVDFIKLDIEGGELPALQGAKRMIEKFRPLIMIEINDLTYKAAGYSSLDVLNFFKEINYSAFGVSSDAQLEPCVQLPSFGNVIFKP